MSLIKQVEDLKSAGRSDSQIVTDLRNQGFMPREIEDALSQFQVKSAVSQEYNPHGDPSSDSNMQQSIMNNSAPPAPAPSNFSPPTPSPNFQPPQDSPYQQSADQNYYEPYSSPVVTSDNYPQYSYSQPQGSEAFSEIAEQVFDQKIVKIKSELSKIDDFKSDTDNKIILLKERIKRIESIIDTLQDSIIRKIGEYGQNIQDLGSDLQSTQNSFSKIIEPLSRSIGNGRVVKPRRKKSKKKVKK
ncbi:MAG: hypothetical protein AABW73_04040 [Nanoarchaeota archaeon]